MDKYKIYKACEKYFDANKFIVASVYSFVLNLLASINNSKTINSNTDLQKIEFFLLQVDLIKDMPPNLADEGNIENSYFGVKVRQLHLLLKMCINKNRTGKTEIVGFNPKSLEFDDLIAIFSTMSRMAYVKSNKKSIKKGR